MTDAASETTDTSSATKKSAGKAAASRELTEARAKLAALDRSQATIEFKPDGTIITANANFLSAMGYGLKEIQGKHHSMFMDPEERDSKEYKAFWKSLANGEFQAGTYRRVAKGGKEIWIQASYNPILDASGKTVSVMKSASDVTAQMLESAGAKGQVDAINRAQAVIHFELDGTIIEANENFLGAMGYSLKEIQGKHHSMFVDAEERKGAAYKAFWGELAEGQFKAGEFKRVNKAGDEIWIQATYNPIFDMNGKPFKVVKFASDITAQKLAAANAEGQLDAINRSQAVIHFELDGTIIEANENFLGAMGYSLEEIQGQHHSMFVDREERSGSAYKALED